MAAVTASEFDLMKLQYERQASFFEHGGCDKIVIFSDHDQSARAEHTSQRSRAESAESRERYMERERAGGVCL